MRRSLLKALTAASVAAAAVGISGPAAAANGDFIGGYDVRGGLVEDGNVIGTLTNTNQINFGPTLFGETIVGAHFGNIEDNLGNSGNLSVFWLFDFGTTGAGLVRLENIRGFSNAVLYTTATGVPEPATWAMVLVGFGAVGFAMRRTRRAARLPQLA